MSSDLTHSHEAGPSGGQSWPFGKGSLAGKPSFASYPGTHESSDFSDPVLASATYHYPRSSSRTGVLCQHMAVCVEARHLPPSMQMCVLFWEPHLCLA